ncbi:hypothetical protein [Pseudomonas putida]|uniref:Uncharacterized protein n=1 Tax=Pseudomonas putida TaxID=303 RepID=A0AAD0LBA2_PSEPU|nr:hypothetical protein [Pseudomonas putida]AXA27179.1 hypothetical protein C1S65_24845 [Pseudomonas putida]
MSKPFDMELFLVGMLTGSHVTRQRHLRQAKLIQTKIKKRWQLEMPWSWQRKHINWFLNQRLNQRGAGTRYYYLLTVRLLVHRLDKPWAFAHKHESWGASQRPFATFNI